MLHNTLCPNLGWGSFIVLITLVETATFIISFIGTFYEPGSIN
jgi:hypothetical protein